MSNGRCHILTDYAMKYLVHSLNFFQGLIRSIGSAGNLHKLQVKVKSIHPADIIQSLRVRAAGMWKRIRTGDIKDLPAYVHEQLLQLDTRIRSIGNSEDLDDFEKRKLGLFNQLNFLGLVTGIIAPIAGIFDDTRLPTIAWIIAFFPGLVSMLVLLLNHHRRYEIATTAYFILQPFVTSLVYLSGINLGVELFFIVYGILSVFFLQRISHMVFSLAFSMISYFMLAVVLKNYQYQLEDASLFFYLFNQVLAISFIFYGLYLIKKENTGYQFSMLAKNRELHRVNLELDMQRAEIAEKAALLEQQTIQLTELNSLKNKLFSVISHDLKTPMYALRNLFSNVQQYDLPAEEVKSLIPDVVNDLNYTTGLMENLLQWAKNQMQSNTIHPQDIDMAELIHDVCGVLRLQAESKKIHVTTTLDEDLLVYADRDMVHLVLRNLLSNAIKFTPEHGNIAISASANGTQGIISIKDSGVGMSEETLQRLFKEYYTSRGTANENGTGLGLMLCKEFLAKNSGQLQIASEEGKGSTFTFTLPLPE